MKILSIETSCDETAISIVEATGDLSSLSFSVLGNALFSQIEIHKKYGGVYPLLAKREHAKNLPPLMLKVLKEASLYKESETNFEIVPSFRKPIPPYMQNRTFTYGLP